jgi:hypothetical protein
MVGYSETSKAYRVYDPEKNEILIRRDVIFDERCIPSTKSSSLSPTSSILCDQTSEENLDEIANEESFESREEEIVAPGTQDCSSTKTRSLQEIYQEGPRQHYANYALMTRVMHVDDPQVFEEAQGKPEWDAPMKDEYDSLMKNQTWELTPLPEGKNLIGCKWIYRTKFTSDGAIEKHKARLVAKGFSQKEGIDYTETFAPVAKMTTIRIVVSLAAKFGWEIHQMDVKSAFLHGDLLEEIYMKQPPGFIKVGQEKCVCKLKKSLYGLKQAPRAWYSKINEYFLNDGFKRSPYDPDLYVKNCNGDIIMVVLYVDDLIITGSNLSQVYDFKKQLKKAFDITDLGLLHYFLGIQVWQEKDRILLSQPKYALDLLKKFKMENCKSAPTPIDAGTKLRSNSISEKFDGTLYRKLVGSLLYLTATRPDIAYAVGMVSRFMSDPHLEHWNAAKRILRYIKGTYNLGLEYQNGGNVQLAGYTDSDWAGDTDDRKSTSGYIFYLDLGAISWSSKKQATISLSSTEAEYKGATLATQEATWLRGILAELNHPQTEATTIYCDNQSTIQLTKNPVFHARTKHIEIYHHYVREKTQKGNIMLKYCRTEDQVADIFTKALSTVKFVKFRSMIGLKEVSP